MGVLGFAGAFAFSHWGIARSTATNAALLITVEPITLMLLSPWLLGERLTRREAARGGAGAPRRGRRRRQRHPRREPQPWCRTGGAISCCCSPGVAYASYSLFGRETCSRVTPRWPVTAWSIGWGTVAMLPLAVLEWVAGAPVRLTPNRVAGALYLAVVITALGYLAWNYCAGAGAPPPGRRSS